MMKAHSLITLGLSLFLCAPCFAFSKARPTETTQPETPAVPAVVSAAAEPMATPSSVPSPVDPVMAKAELMRDEMIQTKLKVWKDLTLATLHYKGIYVDADRAEFTPTTKDGLIAYEMRIKGVFSDPERIMISTAQFIVRTHITDKSLDIELQNRDQEVGVCTQKTKHYKKIDVSVESLVPNFTNEEDVTFDLQPGIVAREILSSRVYCANHYSKNSYPDCIRAYETEDAVAIAQAISIDTTSKQSFTMNLEPSEFFDDEVDAKN